MEGADRQRPGWRERTVRGRGGGSGPSEAGVEGADRHWRRLVEIEEPDGSSERAGHSSVKRVLGTGGRSP